MKRLIILIFVRPFAVQAQDWQPVTDPETLAGLMREHDVDPFRLHVLAAHPERVVGTGDRLEAGARVRRAAGIRIARVAGDSFQTTR